MAGKTGKMRTNQVGMGKQNKPIGGQAGITGNQQVGKTINNLNIYIYRAGKMNQPVGRLFIRQAKLANPKAAMACKQANL